jgi:hypothetical protein
VAPRIILPILLYVSDAIWKTLVSSRTVAETRMSPAFYGFRFNPAGPAQIRHLFRPLTPETIVTSEKSGAEPVPRGAAKRRKIRRSLHMVEYRPQLGHSTTPFTGHLLELTLFGKGRPWQRLPINIMMLIRRSARSVNQDTRSEAWIMETREGCDIPLLGPGSSPLASASRYGLPSDGSCGQP